MAQEKKYIIELSETQLRLIADCVEDCHRFAAGQTELRLRERYKKLDRLAQGMYDAAMNLSTDASQMRKACDEYRNFCLYGDKNKE